MQAARQQALLAAEASLAAPTRKRARVTVPADGAKSGPDPANDAGSVEFAGSVAAWPAPC